MNLAFSASFGFCFAKFIFGATTQLPDSKPIGHSTFIACYCSSQKSMPLAISLEPRLASAMRAPAESRQMPVQRRRAHACASCSPASSTCGVLLRGRAVPRGVALPPRSQASQPSSWLSRHSCSRHHRHGQRLHSVCGASCIGDISLHTAGGLLPMRKKSPRKDLHQSF